MWLELMSLVFEVNEPKNIRWPVQAPLKSSITEHSILDSHMKNLVCYILDNVALDSLLLNLCPIPPSLYPSPSLSLSQDTQYPHNEINDWDKTDILVFSGCF